MEAIWNYFFWQALSTNALDNVGKVLRLSVMVNECSPYEVNPSQQLSAQCNQWLGPYQPGVNAPDPTRTAVPAPTQAAAAKRPSAAPRSRTANPSPLPQPLGGGDTPAPSLPPSVEQLLGGVVGQKPPAAPTPAPKAPSAPGTAPDKPLGDLLDYLLGA